MPFKKLWPRLETGQAMDLLQWQEKILKAVFGAMVLFGLVPLYSSLKMAISTRLWLNAAMYLAGYLMACAVAFARGVPFLVRAWSGVAMVFLLGALAFFTLGPHGSGRIYIYTAAVLASLLLGLRSSLGFLAVVMAFCVVFTHLLNTGAINWTLSGQDPITSWNTTIITFLFLCVATCAALAVLLKGLASALEQSRDYSRQLSEAGDALRKKVEQQERLEVVLRESEERFKDLFDSAPNAYFSLGIDGRIERCNRQGALLLGCASTELTGRSFLDFCAENGLGRGKARGAFERFRQGEEVVQAELQMRKSGGELIWVDLTVSALRDARGRFREGRAIVVDITERKRIAQALASSEQRFRQVFEESPVPLFMQDFSPAKARLAELADSGVGDLKTHLRQNPAEVGRLLSLVKPIFINRATVELYEAGEHQAMERMIADLSRQEERDYFIDQILAFFDGRKRFETTRRELTFEGNEIEIIIKKVVLAGYEADLSRVLTSLVDVSPINQAQREKEQLEEQLRQAQKMEAIGTLAGGIAHDFNNILGVVMGCAEMALEAARDRQDPSADIGQILAAGERARDLVRQILTFSRKVEVDLTPLDLNREVERTTELLERTLPKMIGIETTLGQGVPPVRANANQIEQILLNLAANAQHAMPEGGRLAIETRGLVLDREYCARHLEIRPGRYVLLQVSDTGAGMDKETREHIFDPFFTTKGVGEGTGLGLATVFGIVKGFEGQIACYSEPGMGTTFKIYLPTFGEELSPADDEPHLEREPGPGDETILLVDDDEALRSVGARFLARTGYRVLGAESGEAALELYREQGERIDLVMMDLSMPGMGGQKALKAILELDPAAKVVIASGYAVNGSVKEAMQAGALGYVAKPFHKAELLSTVRKVLDA